MNTCECCGQNIKMAVYGPNENIENIWCKHCKAFSEWSSSALHYICKNCGKIMGFWFYDPEALPRTWVDTDKVIVPFRMKPPKTEK